MRVADFGREEFEKAHAGALDELGVPCMSIFRCAQRSGDCGALSPTSLEYRSPVRSPVYHLHKKPEMGPSHAEGRPIAWLILSILERLVGARCSQEGDRIYTHSAIRRARESFSRQRRARLTFVTNLDHAGDIVERGVGANLAKRAKRNLAFSREGAGEIHEMLQRLATNVRTAAAVFMTDGVRAARELLGEKEVFRDLETRPTEAHFARIRAGRIESVETSALHLDMLRDWKRINAHIAAAAYLVLEKRGELLSSRLRQEL